MSLLPRAANRAGRWPLVALLALAGCAPAIYVRLDAPPTAPLPADSPVLTLPPNASLPPGYTLLGSLFVGDDGTTVNCNLLRMLEVARGRARQAGANVVAVSRVIPPSFLTSTCYQLTADLLQAPWAASEYAPQARGLYDSLWRPPRLPDGRPYALLCAYRLPGGPTDEQPLTLCLNDSVLGLLAPGRQYMRQLPVPGRVRVVLQGHPETEQVLDLEAGHEYYLRGGLGYMGRMVGRSSPRPYLANMPPARAHQELAR